jgi:hypothetical protein
VQAERIRTNPQVDVLGDSTVETFGSASRTSSAVARM